MDSEDNQINSIDEAIQKFRKFNRKTDEVWIKFIIGFWFLAGIYVIYLLIS